MNHSQGGSEGFKKWTNLINKEVQDNKSQNQQQSDKKANGNIYIKSNNGVHLVEKKLMCLYSKGCGFNTTHTTSFHDTRADCVQNNQPFTFLATHLFQKQMVQASGTFNQVASNNGRGTQYTPPINGGTNPAPVDGLYHMSADILYSKYAVQKKPWCEHQRDAVSNPELFLFISDLQKAWNLN